LELSLVTPLPLLSIYTQIDSIIFNIDLYIYTHIYIYITGFTQYFRNCVGVCAFSWFLCEYSLFCVSYFYYFTLLYSVSWISVSATNYVISHLFTFCGIVESLYWIPLSDEWYPFTYPSSIRFYLSDIHSRILQRFVFFIICIDFLRTRLCMIMP